MMNSFSKTDDFIKKYNLFSKTNVSIRNNKFFIVKQVLAGPDMSDFRVLVQFGTFQVQQWYFDEMT